MGLGGRYRPALKALNRYRARIVTYFVQQRSGDVAFVEIKPVGEILKAGDELAVLETIKVDLSLELPVSGRILERNTKLESIPEAINQDPYGAGWMVVIEPSGWEAERAGLLEPQVYFERIKQQFVEELE